MNDRVVRGCMWALGVLIFLEVFIVDMHPKVFWQWIPADMAIIGFVSHMAVVLGCKWLGKHALQRPEDFDA